MYRLLLTAGIDCRFIGGLSRNEAHSWNIVKLNGKYYNIDATWDAGKYPTYKYFLVPPSEFD